MQESKSTGDRMKMLPWKQWSGDRSLEIRMWSSVEWIRGFGCENDEQEENSAAGQETDQNAERNSAQWKWCRRAGSIYEDGAGWKDAWRTGKKRNDV